MREALPAVQGIMIEEGFTAVETWRIGTGFCLSCAQY